MATSQVLAEIGAAAVAAGHPALDNEAVGGVDAATRVAAGEQCDLVFLALGALRKLAESGHVLAGTVTPLMVSQVAVGVPSNSDAPAANPLREAFADAAGMRAALRRATCVGYSTGPSGTALVEMIDDWGMGDELAGRLLQSKPGIPVAQLIAEGGVDLGFQQLSELVGQPGVEILGVLPADCAIDTVFAGAVAASAVDAISARSLLAYFASDEAAPMLEARSFARASA